MSAIDEHVGQQLASDESLILTTQTDLRMDGTFGRRWLVITDQRVLTLDDGARWIDFETEYWLKDISEVRTTHHIGRMAVELEVAGCRRELLSCTNSLTSRFAKIAHALSATCKDSEPFDVSLDGEERRHCDRCGRPLPEVDGFCPVCLKKGRVLARFWHYMQPHWRETAAVSSCMLAAAAVSVTPPYFMKILVDDVIIPARSPVLLLLLVLALLGVHIVGALIRIVQGRVSARFGSRVMHEIRCDLYQAIQGLSMRRHDKTQTGGLISRLTGDTQMLSHMFLVVAPFMIPALLQLVGICVMLFVLEWRLALLVLVPAPVVSMLTFVFIRKLRSKYHHLWQRQARMMARANDTITGIRVVKAFSQEPEEIQRFGARSQELSHATFVTDSLNATYFPLLNLLTMLGTLFVWYFGGVGVMRDALSIGALMAFLAYLGMLYGPLQMLAQFANFINRAFTAAQRIFEITDADQEMYEDADAAPLDAPEGAFEFDNVSFGYVKDRPVLKGVQFKVQAGEMIGLVGRSGVGKTTMTSLICRFYDVEEGVIKLDGIDLRKVRLRDLRRHIGIVPQESYLFDGTVAQNIAFAKPEATKEEIICAAMTANAHGFVMRLPDGYETRVGEGGSRLSGGEKQRIAIARAILHKPKILILDEATSSMDTETEELIQEALARLVENRTTFAIAHRLSTLRNADRLLVIDDGKVAEFGTHEELLQRKGIYAKLVETQSRLSAIRALDG